MSGFIRYNEGAIKNEQSRETGNIVYTRRRKTKKSFKNLAIIMACITPKVTFVFYFIMAILTMIVTGTVTSPVVTMCYRWTN
jgi:hypothetical protein